MTLDSIIGIAMTQCIMMQLFKGLLRMKTGTGFIKNKKIEILC